MTEIEGGASRVIAEIPLTPEGDSVIYLENGQHLIIPGRWESINSEALPE